MLKMLNVGKQNKACRRESGLFVILLTVIRHHSVVEEERGEWGGVSVDALHLQASSVHAWVHHVRTFSPQGALTRKQAHECGNASIVPHLPSREDDFTFTPGSMTSFLPVSAMFHSLFRMNNNSTRLWFKSSTHCLDLHRLESLPRIMHRNKLWLNHLSAGRYGDLGSHRHPEKTTGCSSLAV